MESGLDMSYKDIVKDEKSLIKYLNDLVIRDDMDIENKIFSACIAGRFFELEKSLKGKVDLFMKEMKKEK